MEKCDHPDCPNQVHISGLCRGHRELISDNRYWVVLCKSCGKFLRVALKPTDTSKPTPKYIWALQCRACGGSKEDEDNIKKEYE